MMARRRYRSSGSRAAAQGFAVLMAISMVISMVGRLFQFVSDNGMVFIYIGIAVCGVLISVVITWQRAIARDAAVRLQQQRELESRIAQVRISDARTDYIISNNDYRRGTPRENFY